MQREERIHARNEIHACSHHRRCVNQRRHWRRTFHRVRQPREERNLRALSERAEHEQEWNRARHPIAVARSRSSFKHAKECCVIDRAVVDPNQTDAERKPEVTNAIHDERLFRGSHCRRLRVVVANEQVACETNAFPTEVEHDEIARHHKRRHRCKEDAHAAEESRVALADIGIHVLARVDRDE